MCLLLNRGERVKNHYRSADAACRLQIMELKLERMSSNLACLEHNRDILKSGFGLTLKDSIGMLVELPCTHGKIGIDVLSN